MPESNVFHQTSAKVVGSISAFTDLFRYKLLLERGGWWVDTDVLCLRSELPAQPVVFGWESNGQSVGTAVLKLPPQHWFAERLFSAAQDIVRSRGVAVRWGEIGPVLLTRLVRECGLAEMAEFQHRFYPLGWHEYQRVLLPEDREQVAEKTRESVFVHLWGEMFRRNQIDPATAPPGSWLAAMFARHSGAAVQP